MYSEYSCLYVLHVCLSHTMLIYIVLCRNLIHGKYRVLYAQTKDSNKYYVHVFSIIDLVYIMHGFIIC